MADDKELRVRLPADLRDRLDRFAADTHRTLTGATIALLEHALDANDTSPTANGDIHYR